MTSYLTADQYDQLLRPINPARIGTDGKGFSHVEAYEIRAHLIRIFGPARWSQEVTDQQVVFESSEERTNKKGDPYKAWTVCYRTILRLTTYADDGTQLAVYTEGATGEATNQPSRGDAHDLALKTSQSQALKRCAYNLGDQFGLGLFNKGSRAPLVKRSLVAPEGKPAEKTPDGKPDAPVDAHLTEQLPAESTQADDLRETNDKRPPEQERAAQPDQSALIAAFRDQALNGVGSHQEWARLQMDVSKAKLAKALTTDTAGNEVTLLALIQSCQKAAAA